MLGDLQVKDLPSSIINMQNAPSAPDPTGLAAAYNLLGQSDAFKDLTGLAGTQANAIRALETTSKSVTDLAGMAADLQKQKSMKQDIGKTMKTIQEAETNKQISKDQANQLSMSALGSLVGEPTKKQENLTQEKEVQDLIKSQTTKADPNIKISRGLESIEVSQTTSGAEEGAVVFNYNVPGTVPIIAQPSNLTCWATGSTMLVSWRDQTGYKIEDVMDMAGATYRNKFDNNQGLLGSEKEAFLTSLGMTGEPPMSYTVSGMRALLETHGPLWATTDEQPGAGFSIHARIITGIFGDGTIDGTSLRINDPAGGRQYTETYRAFMQKFEEVADAGKLRVQIVHF